MTTSFGQFKTKVQSWYSVGTISIAAGSQDVVGSGCNWSSFTVVAGDALLVHDKTYEIEEVTTTTTIRLAKPVDQAVTNSEYSVMPCSRGWGDDGLLTQHMTEAYEIFRSKNGVYAQNRAPLPTDGQEGESWFHQTDEDLFYYTKNNGGWSAPMSLSGSLDRHEDGSLAIAQGLNFGQETLNIYDVGTFTPSFQTDTGIAVFTHSIQQGNYVRIGDIVFLWLILQTSSVSANGSNDKLRIGGLPFASKNNSGNHYGGLIFFSKGFSQTSNPKTILYLEGTSNIELETAATGDSRSEFDVTIRVSHMGDYNRINAFIPFIAA